MAAAPFRAAPQGPAAPSSTASTARDAATDAAVRSGLAGFTPEAEDAATKGAAGTGTAGAGAGPGAEGRSSEEADLMVGLRLLILWVHAGGTKHKHKASYAQRSTG